MPTKKQITSILRRQLSYLATAYGVKRIGLFGSCAKDSSRKDSDVDIFAEFDRSIGLKFVEFTEYLERLFGASVDVLTPAGLQGIRNLDVAKEIQETIEYV